MPTIEDLLKEDGDPEGPRPQAPPWHVASHACQHSWIRCGTPPTWILCNCEDPASPWPPRVLGDGPRDCSCFTCNDHDPRWERGKLEHCEYKNHHCDDCHEHKRCTIGECGFGTVGPA